MPNFYKAVIGGTIEGQILNNILYYVERSSQSASFDPSEMGQLATAIEAEVLPALAPLLDPAFEFQTVGITVVDESNTTTSPFEVGIGVSVFGAAAAEAANQGITSIIGFRVGAHPTDPSPRAVRRSYVALGPVSETFTSRDGRILLSNAARESIEDGFRATLISQPTQFQPYRVGRPTPGLADAYGPVVDAIFRPFSSFRRSRLFRASGG